MRTFGPKGTGGEGRSTVRWPRLPPVGGAIGSPSGRPGAGTRAGPVFNAAPVGRVVVTEFYGPFAHLRNRLEWCRIRSPTHGVFDVVIVLPGRTDVPVTVYTNSAAGQRFMADRFPESTTHRVPASALRMTESEQGHRLHCQMHAEHGPLRRVDMEFHAEEGVPKEVPYGGDAPCWGSQYVCTGVDLELPARVRGVIHWDDREEPLAGVEGVLTLGSMGRLERLS